MTQKNLAHVLTTVAFGATLLMPKFAFAENTQYGTSVYGVTTSTSQNASLIKEVYNPVSNSFVKEINAAPNAEVAFRVTVKNTGNETAATMTVKDVLPSYLTYVSGKGTYDTGSKTLTMTFTDVKAGESRSEEVKTKVADKSSFPNEQNTTCFVNTVEMTYNNDKKTDTAKVCVGSGQILGVTSLPEAGLSDYLPLVPVAVMGLFGIGLITRKKTV